MTTTIGSKQGEMTAAAASSSLSSSSSVRYTRLVSALDKALHHSRNHFDIEKAVTDVYGDDASVFGDENADGNVLRGLFESMLDRIHDNVSEEMHTYFQQLDLDGKLLKLERIVAQLQTEEAHRKQAEEEDKRAARLTVEAFKRPAECGSIQDVINSQAFREIRQKRDALQAELATVQADVAALEQETTQRRHALQESTRSVQKLAVAMDKSADVGSLISK